MAVVAFGSTAGAKEVRQKMSQFVRAGYDADGKVDDETLVQSGFGFRDKKLLLNDEMGLERINKIAKIRDDILDDPNNAKALRKNISETKKILRDQAFEFAAQFQAMLFEVALYDLPTSTRIASDLGKYIMGAVEDSLVDLAELVDGKIPATSIEKDALLLNEKLKDVEDSPGVAHPKVKKERAPRSYTS